MKVDFFACYYYNTFINLLVGVFPAATWKAVSVIFAGNPAKIEYMYCGFCSIVAKETNCQPFSTKKRCGQVRFLNFVAKLIPDVRETKNSNYFLLGG